MFLLPKKGKEMNSKRKEGLGFRVWSNVGPPHAAGERDASTDTQGMRVQRLGFAPQKQLNK